jgi:hypothetical protein
VLFDLTAEDELNLQAAKIVLKDRK